jgi:PAS domain S-box-containing protein
MFAMATTKVLFVDDESRLCESITYLLKAKDYEVATAACGQDALDLIADNIFDLAILDVHLPDMLGTRLMGDIKTQHPDTIFIIITGDADVDSAIAALKCGAYDYLRKPFEFEELLTTVENALHQKALKQEKDQIQEQLVLTEERYRYLVQNSPDIIYTLDANGKFTFLNDSVTNLLGFQVEDLIGKNYHTIVWKEDQEKAESYFAEHKTLTRISSEVELRLRLNGDEKRRSCGSNYITAEVKSIGILEGTSTNGGNRFAGIQGVIRNISERLRLQSKLRKAERMESLGTLAGGIAHDFNNLLMGIQGRSALISMDIGPSHPFQEHLWAIDEHIRSGSNLTKQLLGFARGGKYDVLPTDLNNLIHASAEMFGRTRKEIVIETKFHDESIIAEIDRGQIEQVLLNLFVNAWQAMPDGGHLLLETRKVVLNENATKNDDLTPGSYVHVMVQDTGTGMSQSTIGRIFDPFFTTKQKGRGSGLGLASAYGIIKNHGGSINVDSEIDRGTTFHIYLPLSKKPVFHELTPDQPVCNGSETILLVDDEKMIIDVGKSLLEKLGYKVVDVNSGENALDIVRHNGSKIDLIILDMIMPGMDGGKTFDRIHDLYPEIPVILSSGYTLAGKAGEMIEKGFNGFIQKPFTLSEISQKVRQILDAPSAASATAGYFKNHDYKLQYCNPKLIN